MMRRVCPFDHAGLRVNVNNGLSLPPYEPLRITRFTVGYSSPPPDSRTVPGMGFMLPDVPRKDTGGER